MSETDEKELTYEAIDIPTEARAGRRRNPACRHDVRRVLRRGAPGVRRSRHRGRGAGAHYAGRVARLSATEGKYTYKDAPVAIESAFAADLGAPVAQKTPRKARRTNDRAKSRAKPRATAPVRKTARRKAQ